MKRMMCVAFSALMASALVACNKPQAASSFKPALGTNTECSIKVVGEYDNFEAVENEFTRFNKYYPKVDLSYTKLDDYNNSLALALDGTEAANIFFSYPKMLADERFSAVVSHMENLADPELNLNLNCIRSNLINRDKETGRVVMVPVFSRSYGMLINENLFKKEKISKPKNYSELLAVCDSFVEKGYKSPMMGYTQRSSSCLMNTIAYPLFVAELANNPEALDLANKLDPRAGEYTRGALTTVLDLFEKGAIDLTECDKIADNYNAVILRFFEGDVPMMICAGDTVSGTKKREIKSEAFTKSPFKYIFNPIPLTAEGGYFIDSPSVEFSVNKDCEDLEMTNEFMRFLLRTKELDNLASWKGLISSTKTSPFPPIAYLNKETQEVTYTHIYDPFNKVPAGRVISPEVIGITDKLAIQIRIAAWEVGRKTKTVQQAVDNYGEFK